MVSSSSIKGTRSAICRFKQPAGRQRHVPGRQRLHRDNPNGDAGLRVPNAPAGIASVPGGMIYVTEVYTTYTAMTPLSNFASRSRRCVFESRTSTSS